MKKYFHKLIVDIRARGQQISPNRGNTASLGRCKLNKSKEKRLCQQQLNLYIYLYIYKADINMQMYT